MINVLFDYQTFLFTINNRLNLAEWFMDGGTALAKILTVGERSFKKEIDKLLLG